MKKKEMVLTVLLLFLDQGTKWIMEILLKEKNISIIPNFFELELAYNNGAAWSIFKNQRIFLIIIALFTLGILAWMKKDWVENKISELAYPFLYGGIIGNLLDRIVFGHVKDFLHFYIFGYSYPIFNLADIMIVLGAILLIIGTWKGEKNYGRNFSRTRRKSKNR